MSKDRVNRGAVIKGLPPEDPRRALIQGWFAEDGAESCCSRIFSELRISSPSDAGKPISTVTLYDALAFWRGQDRFQSMLRKAVQQAEFEAEQKNLTPEQMEELTDRYFVGMAAETDNSEEYRYMRLLRIADQSAKKKAAVADTKLAQTERQLALARENYELEMQKFKRAIQTKVEAGLAEIAEQVKGNTAAESALARLKEAVKS
jgi:hypothetical protein